MASLFDRLQHRLIPAVLTAIGVSLIASGLLSYTDPVSATPPESAAPTVLPSATSPSLMTLPPLLTPSPSTASGHGVATRVIVPALDIDLPVIRQPGGENAFPPCNVAMYLTELNQPGDPGATYIYAHARRGMFLPILTASQVNNGHRMLGMLIQVYTSDDQLYLYEVVDVRRHQTTLDAAFADPRETLWLQTSEGPRGTIEKVQLVALPIDHGPVNHKDAHPKANPIFCQ